MTDQPTGPGRRHVVLAGAGTAALLGPLAAPASASPSRAVSASPAASSSGDGALDAQPYASYWFPDSVPEGSPDQGVVWRSLKKWRPGDDRDLPFNTAAVPLADRFDPVPANTSARHGQARISALASFGDTAGNPSQGAPTADFYALSHWAYIDELVFWGGSSAEGLIVAPNAPVIDAAHRNGVPVLGTVFLPPAHYDGKLRWTRELVQQDALGGFPLADKLADVAVALGFDGWFINAETDGGDAELGAATHGFLRRLRSRADTDRLRVTWYDALTTEGEVDWQGALNDRNQEYFQDGAGRVSDSMFLDFRWTPKTLAESGRLADGLDRSRYDLWAGVDVEENGWKSDVDWDAIVPTDGPHIVSYGFYRPDWTLGHLPGNRTPGRFHAADDRFWTGESLDPSQPARRAERWRAPAVSVADKSAVGALPFATVFNTGHGLRWYEEGRVTSGAEWNHLGLQDRLPARRWVVRSKGARPAVSFDFADAWRGGSSLLVEGALDAPATVDLYATRLPLTQGTVIDFAHRTDEGSGGVTVELAVALREPDSPGDPVRYHYLPAGTLRSGAGWTRGTVRAGTLLAGLGAENIRALGIRLTPEDGAGRTVWRLGALAVRAEARGEDEPGRPSALKITDTSGESGGTALRFSWKPPAGGSGPDPRHYELHRVLPDGTRRFLGGTCQSVHFVRDGRPEQGERSARFEVRAVGELYTSSAPASTVHRW